MRIIMISSTILVFWVVLYARCQDGGGLVLEPRAYVTSFKRNASAGGPR